MQLIYLREIGDSGIPQGHRYETAGSALAWHVKQARITQRGKNAHQSNVVAVGNLRSQLKAAGARIGDRVAGMIGCGRLLTNA